MNKPMVNALPLKLKLVIRMVYQMMKEIEKIYSEKDDDLIEEMNN